MAHPTTPKVFCIGESKTNETELWKYLESIGAIGWSTDAHNLAEIIEVDGRGCYLSFGTELNDNITRVREGNEEYISNIINVKHGSVLEHGFVNFQIVDVSRVFTHELVRHRAGTAISQESLRFVRANNLGYWIPPCLEDLPDIEGIFIDHFQRSEDSYNFILILAGEKEYRKQEHRPQGHIDKTRQDWVDYFNQLPFDTKKKYTSAARRFLPIGMSTKIGWSCNIRALRGILELRTHPSAEEEMRVVFDLIGKICLERWPAFFADYEPVDVDGYLYFRTENLKI